MHPISSRVLSGWDQSKEGEVEGRSSAWSVKALVIATTLAATLVSPAADAAVTALAPHSTVAGKSIGEWSAAWWQWAFSRGPVDNPFTDGTQAAADNGQAGPVYFLAGTAGGTATRSFNVPADKYLLVPLINAECSDLEGNGTTDQKLRDCANGLIGPVDGLTANGIVFSGSAFDYRESSPGTFSFTAVPGNALFVAPGTASMAVADGYYMMLAPVGPGPQTIEYGGMVSGGKVPPVFETLVTLNLNGVPEPGALILAAAGLLGLAATRRRRA